MPFTPFHLGPGAVFKAIGGRHFSFMVFGGSQVLMDIEPLIGIIQGRSDLHGYTHTLLGALVIGTIAGVIGKPVSTFVLTLMRFPQHPVTWKASFIAAFVGTYSHVALDAMMHSDMTPWWPVALGNQLLGLVPVGWLHVGCFVAAVIGGFAVAFRAVDVSGRGHR
jgi:uncharacterized membrane protein YeaQ/YmgE (transglycosylase-associated protein family)